MSQILVSQIVVPESSFNDPEPWELICANARFVHAVSREGHYERSEFHPACVMLYHILEYAEQVSNGGHEQYIGNHRWTSETNNIVLSGMINIGADKHAELFQTIRSYVDAIPEERERMRIRGGFDDIGGSGPVDSGLRLYDSAYFELQRTRKLESYGSEFLRKHSSVVVVPDTEWTTSIKAIAMSNPHMAERLAAQEEAAARSRAIGLRRSKACLELGALICRVIHSDSGYLIQLEVNGIQKEVVIYWTDKATPQQGRVAYFEDNGHACVADYPDGRILAKVPLGN